MKAATYFSQATTYDALNRPVSTIWAGAPTQITPTATSVTFTHGYDADNRRVSQAANDNSWLGYPGGAGSTAYTDEGQLAYAPLLGSRRVRSDFATCGGRGQVLGMTAGRQQHHC